MNTPFDNNRFHYQRAVLRKSSDNKLYGTLWLVRTHEHVAFTHWAGFGYAFRMSVVILPFLLLLVVAVVMPTMLFGIIGLILLGIPGAIGAIALLIAAGKAAIPKPNAATYLKNAVYVIDRSNIAKVSPASDYRDAVLIVQHDGTADLVHIQGRDQLIHALNAGRIKKEGDL